MAAVAEGVDKFDGYTDFRGAEASRAAVAEYFSKLDGVAISKDDVYLTLGGSLGIYLCIAVLCNPGDNFLMPEAGFPLANTIAKSLGVEVKFYKLNRSNKWQAEIDSMRK
jgi:tyrosine aminotransferase